MNIAHSYVAEVEGVDVKENHAAQFRERKIVSQN